MWTSCFGAELYTLFKIDPTRSTDVLIKVLGTGSTAPWAATTFRPIGADMDRFDVTIQFCLAHLIRDVKFLTTLPGTRDRVYGERLRECAAGALQGDSSPRTLFCEKVPEPIGLGPVQGSELCHGPTCRRRDTVATWRSGSRSMARVISSSLRLQE